MTKPTISIQLWTVKDKLAEDLDGTLARISAIGFSTVEAFDFVARADEFAAAFERHGLVATSGHTSLASDALNPFDPAAPAPPDLDAVFAAAKKLGMTTVIDPFVAPDRWTSLEAITDTATRLNAAAALGKEHGITVGYHNHNQEFQNTIDGRFAFEVFVELLDPAVVIELDLYWAASGGADVPALVTALGERLVAVHVKDGTLEPLPTLVEKPTDQVPAGTGVVPLAASLDAAHHLQLAIVEFDAYAEDIFEGVAISFAFLTGRGLSS